MNISIGSYKVRVEILVAIVVVFWVMFGHLLCGCCKMNLFEGFREGIENNEELNIINILNDNLKKEEEKLEKIKQDVNQAKNQEMKAMGLYVEQFCDYKIAKKQLEELKARELKAQLKAQQQARQQAPQSQQAQQAQPQN